MYHHHYEMPTRRYPRRITADKLPKTQPISYVVNCENYHHHYEMPTTSMYSSLHHALRGCSPQLPPTPAFQPTLVCHVATRGPFSAAAPLFWSEVRALYKCDDIVTFGHAVKSVHCDCGCAQIQWYNAAGATGANDRNTR